VKPTDHLEAERTIDHEQDEISNFADVNHGIDVIIALDKGEVTVFTADNGDGAVDGVEGLFSVAANETFEKRGFTNARGPYDSYNDGRGILNRCSAH
jgi:hypothetical protein